MVIGRGDYSIIDVYLTCIDDIDPLSQIYQVALRS